MINTLKLTNCKLDRILGLMFFGFSVVWLILFIYSVIRFSINSVLWIRSTGPARKEWENKMEENFIQISQEILINNEKKLKLI